MLLILFVGAAQALHTHASDEAANPGCSLCAVAHVSALVAPEPAAPVKAETVLAVSLVEPAVVPSYSFPFGLCIRPPPASSTLS